MIRRSLVNTFQINVGVAMDLTLVYGDSGWVTAIISAGAAIVGAILGACLGPKLQDRLVEKRRLLESQAACKQLMSDAKRLEEALKDMQTSIAHNLKLLEGTGRPQEVTYTLVDMEIFRPLYRDAYSSLSEDKARLLFALYQMASLSENCYNTLHAGIPAYSAEIREIFKDRLTYLNKAVDRALFFSSQLNGSEPPADFLPSFAYDVNSPWSTLNVSASGGFIDINYASWASGGFPLKVMD